MRLGDLRYDTMYMFCGVAPSLTSCCCCGCLPLPNPLPFLPSSLPPPFFPPFPPFEGREAFLRDTAAVDSFKELAKLLLVLSSCSFLLVLLPLDDDCGGVFLRGGG